MKKKNNIITERWLHCSCDLSDFQPQRFAWLVDSKRRSDKANQVDFEPKTQWQAEARTKKDKEEIFWTRTQRCKRECRSRKSWRNKGSETKYLGWSATLTCRFSLLVVEGWHINWVQQGYFSLPRYFSLSAPIHNLCYGPLAFAVAVVLSSESSVTISTSLPAICLTACKWARYRFTLHHIYSQQHQ